jgi:hypothetical protein
VINDNVMLKEQSIQSKKGSVDTKAGGTGPQRILIDMHEGGAKKKKGVIQITGPAGAQLMDPRRLGVGNTGVNSPKGASGGQSGKKKL